MRALAAFALLVYIGCGIPHYCLATLPPRTLHTTIVAVAHSSYSHENKVASVADYGRPFPASIAATYVPGWPGIGSSQSSYDVIYFPQNQATASTFNPALMLCLVNNLRISRGLMPVVYHDRLMRLAQAHSRFQAYYKVITHADTAGQIGDRLSTLGFDWGILLENVGAGANSEPGIVDAWSKSPGHLSNMLNPDVRYMGVDVFNGFWVQDFASPRDKGYVVPTSQIDACPSLSDLTIYY